MIYESVSQNIAETLLYGAAFHIERREKKRKEKGER